jgi:CRISPR/Cas system CMR-associated protein Cmr5 small subunit
MSKSVVGVSDSSDPSLIEYVQKQLEAIIISFPDVSIQHVDENNEIMERYARYPNRVPAFFILKNGARMGVLQAKVSTEELLAWVTQNIG